MKNHSEKTKKLLLSLIDFTNNHPLFILLLRQPVTVQLQPTTYPPFIDHQPTSIRLHTIFFSLTPERLFSLHQPINTFTLCHHDHLVCLTSSPLQTTTSHRPPSNTVSTVETKSSPLHLSDNNHHALKSLTPNLQPFDNNLTIVKTTTQPPFDQIHKSPPKSSTKTTNHHKASKEILNPFRCHYDSYGSKRTTEFVPNSANQPSISPHGPRHVTAQTPSFHNGSVLTPQSLNEIFENLCQPKAQRENTTVKAEAEVISTNLDSSCLQQHS
ncbi:hypothetical protein KIW84_022723 [Lathyrus oleraceus]|uniref:Uncharacterized protein n=1 Tax=Pisum sativum TaxID=3888 RepID=A0A9D4YD66_PEA|nr:hypothetical protein KIW84_022723 [Pisum sativum]